MPTAWRKIGNIKSLRRQQCAALKAERDELKRERDELRATIKEMSNAHLEYRLATEERRQAQQALLEMYRHRERERDRLRGGLQ